MKKVLVTGGGGYLGGHVVDALIDAYNVTAFDIKAPGHGIRHVAGDVTDPAALADACDGMDAVIHIAAKPNIWSAPGDEIIRVNVGGTWNVLEAAERAGVKRVVLCSSDSVMGNTVWRQYFWPPRTLPVDEDHPLRPTDPYALSKLMGEQAGRAFAARGHMEVVALRPVFILFEQMFGEVVSRNRDPETYQGPAAGGPSPAGGGLCWHHVDPRDLAVAFKNALAYDYRGFEAFYLCADSTLAPEPTLERIENFFGALPELRDPGYYDANPFAPMYDNRRSKEVLGLSYRHDHRERVLSEVKA